MHSVRFVERALRDWDALGILRGCSMPEDEYDSYAPHIVSMAANGVSVDEIASHLGRLRTEYLGAHRDEDKDRAIAIHIAQQLRPSNKSLERSRDG